MGAAQQLLFPDPRPLVERLGSEFFRELPDCPGVYLMRDAGNAVLYVGKAINLRKRLGSYRVANPDRLARRHLRLLRSVARIELEPCANEAVALAREAELLLQLRPRFNRAGTWPGKARYLVWRHMEQKITMAVVENADEGWQSFGPMNGGAVYLQATLARLLWFVASPGSPLSTMPAGWMRHRFDEEIVLRCGDRAGAAAGLLDELFVRRTGGFCERLRGLAGANLLPFEKSVLEENLERISFLLEPEPGDGVEG